MIDIQTIIAVLILYALPLLIGRAVYIASKKLLYRFVFRSSTHPHILPPPFAFITYFIMGALSFYFFTLFCWYILHPFVSGVGFIPLWKGATVVLTVISLIINALYYPRVGKESILKHAGILLGAAVLSISTYLIWQWYSPYPFNWDLYHHQTLINAIQNGTFSFVTSHLSDTFIFNGYSTLFHTLLAFPQVVTHPEIFSFWHGASIIHSFLTIVASYYIAKEISENETVSLIAMFIGAFIFESVIVFSSFFLIPQTFTAVIFAFLIIQMLAVRKRKFLLPLPLIIIGCLFLFLSHYVIGTVAIGIYLALYLYFRYHTRILPLLQQAWTVEIAIVAAIAILILSAAIPLGFLNEGEGAAYTFNLADKFNYMRRIYGFLLLFCFPIGAVRMAQSKKELSISILVVSSCLLLIVLTQLPYVLKFYVLARYFIHVVIAIGVYSLLSYIKPLALRICAAICFVAVLVVILVNNSLVWQNFLYYRTITAQISPNEVEAAAFLHKNYANKQVLMVSDPATQHLLEPLSGINSQGGAYMNYRTRQLLEGVNNATSSAEIASKLYDINDAINPIQGKRLFILSGRYFMWQNMGINEKNSISYNVWLPTDLTFPNEVYIETVILPSSLFKLVFKNESLAIFEVEQP